MQTSTAKRGTRRRLVVALGIFSVVANLKPTYAQSGQPVSETPASVVLMQLDAARRTAERDSEALRADLLRERKQISADEADVLRTGLDAAVRQMLPPHVRLAPLLVSRLQDSVESLSDVLSEGVSDPTDRTLEIVRVRLLAVTKAQLPKLVNPQFATRKSAAMLASAIDSLRAASEIPADARRIFNPQLFTTPTWNALTTPERISLLESLLRRTAAALAENVALTAATFPTPSEINTALKQFDSVERRVRDLAARESQHLKKLEAQAKEVSARFDELQSTVVKHVTTMDAFVEALREGSLSPAKIDSWLSGVQKDTSLAVLLKRAKAEMASDSQLPVLQSSGVLDRLLVLAQSEGSAARREVDNAYASVMAGAAPFAVLKVQAPQLDVESVGVGARLAQEITARFVSDPLREVTGTISDIGAKIDQVKSTASSVRDIVSALQADKVDVGSALLSSLSGPNAKIDQATVKQAAEAVVGALRIDTSGIAPLFEMAAPLMGLSSLYPGAGVAAAFLGGGGFGTGGGGAPDPRIGEILQLQRQILEEVRAIRKELAELKTLVKRQHEQVMTRLDDLASVINSTKQIAYQTLAADFVLCQSLLDRNSGARAAEQRFSDAWPEFVERFEANKRSLQRCEHGLRLLTARPPSAPDAGISAFFSLIGATGNGADRLRDGLRREYAPVAAALRKLVPNAAEQRAAVMASVFGTPDGKIAWNSVISANAHLSRFHTPSIDEFLESLFAWSRFFAVTNFADPSIRIDTAPSPEAWRAKIRVVDDIFEGAVIVLDTAIAQEAVVQGLPLLAPLVKHLGTAEGGVWLSCSGEECGKKSGDFGVLLKVQVDEETPGLWREHRLESLRREVVRALLAERRLAGRAVTPVAYAMALNSKRVSSLDALFNNEGNRLRFCRKASLGQDPDAAECPGSLDPDAWHMLIADVAVPLPSVREYAQGAAARSAALDHLVMQRQRLLEWRASFANVPAEWTSLIRESISRAAAKAELRRRLSGAN